MFATQSGKILHPQRLSDYLGENPEVSDTNQREDFADFFFRTTGEFSWVEQVYQAGDSIALAVTYKNLPHHLQYNVDQLILEAYREKLFRVPLFEATLLQLSSGCLPGFRPSRERLNHFKGDRI